MIRGAGVGAPVGRAYVPGHGIGQVFNEGNGHFTIQTADGQRFFRHRSRINWRSSH